MEPQAYMETGGPYLAAGQTSVLDNPLTKVVGGTYQLDGNGTVTIDLPVGTREFTSVNSYVAVATLNQTGAPSGDEVLSVQKVSATQIIVNSSAGSSSAIIDVICFGS